MYNFEFIATRKNSLLNDIKGLCDNRISNIQSIVYCYSFVRNSLKNIECQIELGYKESISNCSDDNQVKEFINLFNLTEIQGNLNLASGGIPEDFRKIENRHLDFKNEGSKIIFTYMYHQFFLSMISILDDFFAQLITLILKAYPEKIAKKQIKLSPLEFNTFLNKLQRITDLPQQLGLPQEKDIIDWFDKQIYDVVTDIMKNKNALEQLDKLEDYLQAEKKLLRLYKLQYYEMYLRRNAGIHSSWMGEKEYQQKFKEIKKRANGDKLLFEEPIYDNFLGFSERYFYNSCIFCQNIIILIEKHCEQKFNTAEQL
ncbi:hypothetical protein B6N60_01289 [Richelia sinica FACHB-800]|uniref:Uncharacterized protein n=1 Tax=Richelia sinica FACHB-800 TaxID=1357546 RepID=A0A975Y3X9_9NOST|nr:hypothetical protein [Richelia sinica]MBD2664179.1 hypothetical protein [Richelia sinica FACHB-800]QXE22604.1 hypothetical protein B6N60_01289 [Richelia sinica FACHB-800]